MCSKGPRDTKKDNFNDREYIKNYFFDVQLLLIKRSFILELAFK